MSTVITNTLGAFGGPITSFSDSLAVATSAGGVNLFAVNNKNWTQVVLNWQTAFNNPVGWPSFNFQQLLSNLGGTGLKVTIQQTGANPPYFVCAGIIPVPLWGSSKYYTFQQKFVQLTWNNQSGSNLFFGFVNFEDNSGTGIGHANGEVAHDGYFVGADGSLNRCNSVAHESTLQTGTAASQGDVFRLGMDQTVAGQVSLTLTRNGTVEFTFVDNNIDRLLGGAVPVICVCNGLAASFLEVKNFSSGIGL